MHTVNVGTKGHKKMTLRDFLRNNMSLFDDMICKDIKIASQIETNPEAWKKDFEIVLKVQMILFFNSCRNLGYIHFCVGKPNYAKIFNYFSSTSKFNHYI